MREVAAAGDIWEAWIRDVQLFYVNLRCKKAKLAHEKNPDKYLLEAVGILIYNFHFHDDPDNMFKSSLTMAQIIVNMDQEGPENPLQSEETFYDYSYLRCIGCKTLAFLCIIKLCGTFS